jgi:hypothetical protein
MGGPSRDLQRVAVAKQTQNLVEPRTARSRADRVVDVDVLLGDAGAPQRVELVVGILVGGRDARVAEQNPSRIPDGGEVTVVVSRRELSTPRRPGNAAISKSLPRASANVRFRHCAAPDFASTLPWWRRVGLTRRRRRRMRGP